ncbi:MAG: hypothetical protein U1F25_03995 [Rubrivivax sp.]
MVITQHRLLHYRLGLFEHLRTACAARGIELRLVHQPNSPTEALKKDTGVLPWADAVRNRFLHVKGVDLIWQPYPRELPMRTSSCSFRRTASSTTRGCCAWACAEGNGLVIGVMVAICKASLPMGCANAGSGGGSIAPTGGSPTPIRRTGHPAKRRLPGRAHLRC